MSQPRTNLYDDDKIEAQHIEGQIPALSSDEQDVNLKAAIAAEQADIQMGILEAVRKHKAAVFWSLMVSMTVVMESYDLCLLGNLLAMPAFRKQFGEYSPVSGDYQLKASWQTGLTQASVVGAFVGILICGQIVEPLGYRKTIMLGLVLMIGAVFLTFFAETLPVLLVGEFCCGVPWGFFINIAPAYASEVAPIALRGILTIYVQICWCIGQFVSSGVTFSTHDRPDKWAYKIPFALQWMWPAPLLVIIFFAPESPWWLVRKGRFEEAERVVKRLGHGSSGSTTASTSDTIQFMVRTNELEKAETAGASFLACFKGTELRRTAIVCLIFAYQNFSGNQIGNQATYFFEQAGLPVTKSFSLGLGNTAIQMTAVFFCWILTAYFGRRTLYLWGVGFNFLFLLGIGIAASVPRTITTTWIQAVFMILVYAQYGLTIGPVTYAVIAETSSVRLRAKSVGLSRNFYYIWSVISGVLNTYMLSSTAWNLAGQSAFVWAGTSAIVWVTCYYGLPEFKGRSAREIDILFHRKVPARKFASTKVDENSDE